MSHMSFRLQFCRSNYRTRPSTLNSGYEGTYTVKYGQNRYFFDGEQQRLVPRYLLYSQRPPSLHTYHTRFLVLIIKSFDNQTENWSTSIIKSKDTESVHMTRQPPSLDPFTYQSRIKTCKKWVVDWPALSVSSLIVIFWRCMCGVMVIR
jgi:hypothetical protein